MKCFFLVSCFIFIMSESQSNHTLSIDKQKKFLLSMKFLDFYPFLWIFIYFLFMCIYRMCTRRWNGGALGPCTTLNDSWNDTNHAASTFVNTNIAFSIVVTSRKSELNRIWMRWCLTVYWYVSFCVRWSFGVRQMRTFVCMRRCVFMCVTMRFVVYEKKPKQQTFYVFCRALYNVHERTCMHVCELENVCMRASIHTQIWACIFPLYREYLCVNWNLRRTKWI